MIGKLHVCGKWKLSLHEPRLVLEFNGPTGTYAMIEYSGDVRRDLQDLRYLIDNALDQPDVTPMGGRGE